MNESETIRPQAFEEAVGADGWRVVGDGGCAFFPTGSFEESARFVAAIGEALDEDGDHRPDVDIRHDGVTVRVVTATDDDYGMTSVDVELARRISAAAGELGLASDASRVQSVLVIPGASNVAEVMPFWQAALAYERRGDTPDEDLVDPRGRGPAFWFEPMDEPRADGGGAIHIAVWVPQEEAEARVAAALDAGGRMVRDDFAPAWWTIADAAGNEADIATIKSRD